MRFHNQAFLHDPDNGVYGDCYRTALACMLGLERDDIPHFVTSMEDGVWNETIQPKYDEFLNALGYQELAIPLLGDRITLQEALEWQQARTPYSSTCMLTGKSSTLCNHVVIVRDGEIIHDPATDNAGITGPTEQGLYWFTWILPIEREYI